MVGDRINELRGNETQGSFCERFGISKSSIARYENGTNQPDAKFLVALCDAYNVHANWLLTGEGPKYRDTSSPVATNTTIAHMPSDNLGLGESVELLAKIYNSGNTVLIRAIAANLNAFSEAIDNKDIAQKAINMMDEMNKRMLAMESSIATLQNENKELKKDQPRNNQYESTG